MAHVDTIYAANNRVRLSARNIYIVVNLLIPQGEIRSPCGRSGSFRGRTKRQACFPPDTAVPTPPVLLPPLSAALAELIGIFVGNHLKAPRFQIRNASCPQRSGSVVMKGALPPPSVALLCVVMIEVCALVAPHQLQLTVRRSNGSGTARFHKMPR